MANNYADPDDALRVMEKSKWTQEEELSMILCLDAAAARVDTYCGRESGMFVADSTASARTFVGSGSPVQRIPECAEISAVAVKDSITASSYTSWDSTDYISARGDPKDPDFNNTPYTLLVCAADGDYSSFLSGRWSWKGGFRPDPEQYRQRGYPTVQVTAKWGYATTVPDTIKLATVMVAVRWYKRLQSGMSDTLASGELGQMLYTMRLDPDVEGMLKDSGFKRPIWLLR